MTSPEQIVVLGWDIGGVNTKVARVSAGAATPFAVTAKCLPYEVKQGPGALAANLARLGKELRPRQQGPHAVTMTAELSQAFRTKREGVDRVLAALEEAFPGEELRIYAVSGEFLDPSQARGQPLEVGASNWAATARLVGQFVTDCILVDIGTTSTDIIPVVAGEPRAQGRTDPERLLSGELVYTGALRTPAEAVATQVPLWSGQAGVSADGFALIGDAHVWLGRLRPEDYTVPSPDGRPVSREFAGERLARLVGADREMLDEGAVNGIAQALAEAQLERVVSALRQVRGRHTRVECAVVTGLGDFIAAEAACRAGLEVVPLSDHVGDVARHAPAVAVAWLLAEELMGRPS
jgi:(4-(4-[2-(gamma-L-glutamylamino)ethyl]phenoxymethyl)furan-2-yl)methanamine synthase